MGPSIYTPVKFQLAILTRHHCARTSSTQVTGQNRRVPQMNYNGNVFATRASHLAGGYGLCSNCRGMGSAKLKGPRYATWWAQQETIRRDPGSGTQLRQMERMGDWSTEDKFTKVTEKWETAQQKINLQKSWKNQKHEWIFCQKQKRNGQFDISSLNV